MRVSISNKIGIFVAGSLLVLLGIMMTVLLSRSSAMQMNAIETSAIELSEILHRSAVFAMGEGITDVSPLKEMLQELPEIEEVRILPTHLIDEDRSRQLDQEERAALQAGKKFIKSETFGEKRVLRIIEPVLAEENCTICHESDIGDPLASISIRYSTEEALSEIAGQKWLAVFLTVVTIVITFFVIMLLVNRNVLRDLKSFVEAIKNLALGDIDNSMETDRNDELGDAAQHLKILQENIEHKTNLAVKISKGLLDSEVKPVSEKDGLGKAMVKMQESIRLLTEDVVVLMSAATEGQLDVRADASAHDGEYRKIISGFNQTLDTFVQPMQVAETYLKKIASGDLEETISEQFAGDFQNIIDSMNSCIQTIKTLKEDTVMLSTAAIAGDLSVRADAERHSGDYKKIVEGINSTLDALLEPIMEMQTIFQHLEKGNMTVKMMGHYNGEYAKLKDNLNATIQTLHGLLGKVSAAVDHVSTGAQQVSDSSQAVSQGATEQASSLEEITASMTEIGSQSKHNSENAAQADQLASVARGDAQLGSDRIKEMLDSMAEINDSSDKISKIIKVIEEIAFQTNLLALNAAVEAARAGVHGKGFAVVAEEVRNLAQRSAKAASETTNLIQNSVDKARKGSEIADQSAEALYKIIEGITKVSDLIGEIASASQEQVQGLQQVNQGLNQIDQVTQTNTANAEESASVAEELSGQAVQLKNMIRRFQLECNAQMESDAFRLTGHQQEYKSPDAFGKKTDNKREETPELILDDDDFGSF